MSYNCEICNYTTTDSGNFCKHKKTKRHMQNVTSQESPTYDAPNWSSWSHSTVPESTEFSHLCKICGRSFSKAYNLNRHQKLDRCKGNPDKIKNLEGQFKIFQLEHLLKFQEMETQHKVKEAELKAKLEAEEKANKEKSEYIMSGQAGGIINYNMSARHFVEKNYPDAPALTCLNPDKMETLGEEEKGMELVDVLIYYYNERRLANYLGDFLVRHYKKKNPSDQSVWTSDTSRLTYIIKELMTNNKTIWNADKKGLKTKDFIVVPMLEHIKPHLVDYIKEKSEEAKDITVLAEQVVWYDKISAAYKIHTSIENNKLADEIIKYIAPHLYVDKTDIGDEPDDETIVDSKYVICYEKKTDKLNEKEEKIELENEKLVEEAFEKEEDEEDDEDEEEVHVPRKTRRRVLTDPKKKNQKKNANKKISRKHNQ